jgi:hypothetical protein
VVIEMLTGQVLKDLLPRARRDLPQQAGELLRRLGLPLSEESIEMLVSALKFDPDHGPRNAGLFARPLVRDLES